MSTAKFPHIVNKKARFEYHILQKYTAGLLLSGSEVKSIRAGNASIGEAYCYIQNGEMFIKGMHIGRWNAAGFVHHEPLAERKLLLNRSELKKIINRLKDVGITIVPLELLLSETGYIKIEIAIVQGKKTHDKREAIKERELDRNMRRNSD